MLVIFMYDHICNSSKYQQLKMFLFYIKSVPSEKFKLKISALTLLQLNTLKCLFNIKEQQEVLFILYLFFSDV